MAFVGIIANPASGKDIRRLVAFGSVFDNQEKVRIVRRVLLGLQAVGVERIMFMPDYFGIVSKAAQGLKLNIPLFPANFKATATQADSTQAARIMAERGVRVIVTLGGDGTNRAVVKGTAEIPLLPISTGTNNVFPRMVEGTLAGLAAGLVATGQVPAEEVLIFSTRLNIDVDGQTVDLALVDVAVCDDVFTGSRAVWKMDKVRQLFLNRAAPDSIGFSAIGGLLHPLQADTPAALNLTLGASGQPVQAAIAPGIIQRVFVAQMDLMAPDETVPVRFQPSVLALDGERELTIAAGRRAAVRLVLNGPPIIEVSRVMDSAQRHRVLTSAAPLSALRTDGPA